MTKGEWITNIMGHFLNDPQWSNLSKDPLTPDNYFKGTSKVNWWRKAILYNNTYNKEYNKMTINIKIFIGN